MTRSQSSSPVRSAFDTRSVHNQRRPEQQGGMVSPPVYHGSTVVYQSLDDLEAAKRNHDEKDALVYGRFGTPATFAFENAVADLENGYGALSVSSGMAAVSTAVLGFVETGDHLLMVDSVYGPSRMFCDQFLRQMGVEVTYYDPLIGAGIESLIQSNTRLIYMESPGSITFEIQDVPAIVAVAKQHGIATALDNSWATPLFFRPIDHGVNVSVIAATKYISGHSDAMIGMVVCDNEESFKRVKRCRDLLGHCLAPDDIFLGMRGMRTLALRARQHEQQGLTLARWLDDHDDVLRVLHPALPGCPGHDLWKRDFEGSTGLFSFILPDRGREALACLLDNLSLYAMGFSWGGFESLIVPQNATNSRTATCWDHPGQLLRVHAGLEDIDDLIGDLAAGLERYRQFKIAA